MKILAKDRVAHGLCPQCGKEAAPFRLCYDCRQMVRFTRAMKRGVRHGVLQFMGSPDRFTKSTLVWKGSKFDDRAANDDWRKWSTPIHLSQDDRRSSPRVRNVRIDVEATLIKVVQFIGHPCTIDEIMQAWGRLRAKRDAPLAHDLARIVVANEKRAEKNARRAAAWEKSQSSRSQPA